MKKLLLSLLVLFPMLGWGGTFTLHFQDLNYKYVLRFNENTKRLTVSYDLSTIVDKQVVSVKTFRRKVNAAETARLYLDASQRDYVDLVADVGHDVYGCQIKVGNENRTLSAFSEVDGLLSLLSVLRRDKKETHVDELRGVPFFHFFMNGVIYRYDNDRGGYIVHGFEDEDCYKGDNSSVFMLGQKIFASWNNGTDQDIPVVRVCSGAFYWCSFVKKVIIMGIPTIESSAFNQCENLEVVDFRNEGTKVIKEDAFLGCPKVKEVRFNFYSNPPQWAGYSQCFKRNDFKVVVCYGDPSEVTRFKRAYPVWANRIVGEYGIGYGWLPSPLGLDAESWLSLE